MGAIMQSAANPIMPIPGLVDPVPVPRAVTPREALDRGASMLVIGRPISQAEDPDQAARAIEATL